MANMANITVFDGASTPVSHVLIAEEVARDLSGSTSVALWREQLPTVPNYAQARYTQIKRKLKSGTTQVINRMEVPVMESIGAANALGYTSAPKVAYTDKYELHGFHSERSTEASKTVCLQMLRNLINNVATSVTPISAGWVAESQQKLIQAT